MKENYTDPIFNNVLIGKLMKHNTWQVTANVWHICVFPVLNSPNISVIEPVSIPPMKEIFKQTRNEYILQTCLYDYSLIIVLLTFTMQLVFCNAETFSQF